MYWPGRPKDFPLRGATEGGKVGDDQKQNPSPKSDLTRRNLAPEYSEKGVRIMIRSGHRDAPAKRAFPPVLYAPDTYSDVQRGQMEQLAG